MGKMSRLLEEQVPRNTPASAGAGSQGSAGGLPKGVVLDKDGKPCRTCTSSSAWMSMMKSSGKKSGSESASRTTTTTTAGVGAGVGAGTDILSTSTSSQPHPECPPDVEELGRSSWTLLHSLTATYPDSPSASMQTMTKQFISLFSRLYPCWVCADDFRAWMAKPENDIDPELESQDRFGKWMCRAHNEVNRKLGKEEFDCNLWKERWKDGWKDGRCD